MTESRTKPLEVPQEVIKAFMLFAGEEQIRYDLDCLNITKEDATATDGRLLLQTNRSNCFSQQEPGQYGFVTDSKKKKRIVATVTGKKFPDYASVIPVRQSQWDLKRDCFLHDYASSLFYVVATELQTIIVPKSLAKISKLFRLLNPKSVQMQAEGMIQGDQQKVRLDIETPYGPFVFMFMAKVKGVPAIKIEQEELVTA